jgi:hypothetical protein
LKSGELKPRQGHPWVLYLLAHGSNDKTKSTNDETQKLKHGLRKELLDDFYRKNGMKLQWLDQTIDEEPGQGWAEYRGCYIVYIWPHEAN